MHRSLSFMSAAAGVGLMAGFAAADPISLDFIAATGTPSESSGTDTAFSISLTLDSFAFRIPDRGPFEGLGVVLDPMSEWSRMFASTSLFLDTIAAEDSADAGSISLTFEMSGDIADAISFELATLNAAQDDPARVEWYSWMASAPVLDGVDSATGWSRLRDEAPVVIIPLPSAAGLAAVGLTACCIRRRRMA